MAWDEETERQFQLHLERAADAFRDAQQASIRAQVELLRCQDAIARGRAELVVLQRVEQFALVLATRGGASS
jgi:hypothetical protein